jgi:hypothetical protein
LQHPIQARPADAKRLGDGIGSKELSLKVGDGLTGQAAVAG